MTALATEIANKIGIVSLGCPKALVDSEHIMTRLRAEGYEFTPSYEEANLVIINTCGFVDAAIEESLQNIEEALLNNGRVIVTGCLGARANFIKEKFPEVLNISGPHAYEAVMNAVHEHLPPPHDPFQHLIPAQGIKLTPRHYAYLKISEGCNHKCRFCIIPSMRGKLISRPIGEVMNEAKRLVDAGVNELLIISQDTSAYGVDCKYRTDFWNGRPLKTRFYQLAETLGELGVWVRLHYVYPYPHVDEVIPLMAAGKILPYLDIPLQHASPNILKSMRRPACTENTLQRIMKWRQICPDITIRSTFIVGFPGETEADFSDLLNFLEKAQLDRVGCFTYSPVDGAAANQLPNPVPENIKQERYDRFMQKQLEISQKKLKNKIGKTLPVIIDSVSDQYIIARSQADAPEIDGLVYLEKNNHVEIGQIVKATITAADEYDLWGNAT